MLDVKACLVCLSTNIKLHKIDSARLKQDYFLVSGLKVDDLCGLPQFLCVECVAYVCKFKKFRDKCKRGHFALKEIFKTNKQINELTIKAIDRKAIDIMPDRSFVKLKRLHYETVKFKWNKESRSSIDSFETIPVFHYSTIALEKEFEVPRKKPRLLSNEIKVELEDIDADFEFSNDLHDNGVASDDHDDFYSSNIGSNDYGVLKEEVVDSQDVDGMKLEEEYATLIPITMIEARAVFEVNNLYASGTVPCTVCNRKFLSQKRFDAHVRMHDQYFSGSFKCEICFMYYKSEFLLKTHMTEKHMYKYICKKCPEVCFDRRSSKQHFIWAHLQKRYKKDIEWDACRPSWLSNKGGRRHKGAVSLKPTRKKVKLPSDFLIYQPVSQEEQYKAIEDRKKTRNYLLATYKCELCYRGFQGPKTYGTHMKKHDPAIAGPLQCDMCKLHFRSARKMYKHMMISHVAKFSCQLCEFICHSKSQARLHYSWHKNVIYKCPHCFKEFRKLSSQLTHIRIKHPSTNICNICGHSFVSDSGLICHRRLAHTAEELKTSDALYLSKESSNPRYCADCDMTFVSDAAYVTHLGSSNKHSETNLSIRGSRRTFRYDYAHGGGGGGGAGAGSGGVGDEGAGPGAGRRRRVRRHRDVVNNGVAMSTVCEVCQKVLPNDVQAKKHYESEHPGREFLKRYMCDVCGHVTKQYANLMVHMRTHTLEKPYECPHCDRKFSMPSNRDRHIVVHTGEKKYQCHHCNRRFTQSSAVKLHIQTVHLKIPYAPWDKKNRKRRKELESMEPISTITGEAIQPLHAVQSQPKLLLDGQGDCVAYITYNGE